MADNMIKFLKGSVASLPQTATPGAVYFTEDEGLYLGLQDGTFHRYGDFITVANVAALPAAGAHETCMYYCVEENVLAKWNGEGWTQINKQKTLAELGGVAKSVYEAKMAALEKADSDNATAISGVDTRLQTVETAIGTDGSVTKAIATAQSQADKGVADAAAALAEAQKKTTMADVEAKNYATKSEAQGYADAKDEAIAAAKKAGDDAAAAAKTADDKAVAAQSAADKAQDEVDALEILVGALPEGTTATSIVDYVNKKTEGIATDTALGELNSQVSGLQTAVQGIQADYLKTVDKTELSDAIALKADQTAVDAIDEKIGDVTEGKTVVEMIEAAKTAATYDDTKVKEDIAANAEAIALLNDDAETEGSVDYKIAQAVAAIMQNPDETMNSINELVTWINGHAEDALELSNQVAANKDDIAALEGLVGTTGVAAQIEAAIAAALKVDGVDKYALASDLTAAIGRIAAMEGKVANWDAAEQNAKDYADQKIADLKIGDYVKKTEADAAYAAIDHNHDEKYDAKGDADKALSDAKAYADGLAGNYATAAQGAKADTALQSADITTGSANGTIAVKGADVAVKGLGSAAYADTTAFDAAGTAETKANAAEAAAKAYADGLKTTIDAAYAAADTDLKTELQTYADTAESDAVATSKAYTDTALTWGSF